MLLIVDNGSLFTGEIVRILSKSNIKNHLVPFHLVSQLDLNNFNSFILSGRQKNEQKMNAINSKIINHAVSEEKSLLGICYGAEILATTLGGTIRKSNNTIKGLHMINIVRANPLSEKDIQVYQSHSYEIAKLGSQLQNFAKSNTCQYEIIKHESLPIFGTQFHPEMSEGGQKVIEAFIGL